MFIVERHCDDPNCTAWEIRWPDAKDEDGVPAVGLWWEDKGGFPFLFPQRETAERFAAHLNKAANPKGLVN